MLGLQGNIGANVSVPMAAFTSSGDGIWEETLDIYNAIPAGAGGNPKVYRDQVGFSHLEPVLAPPIENPYLATFTAAWFKVYLGGVGGGSGGDRAFWYDLIYNRSNPASLCNYANMTACYLVPGKPPPAAPTAPPARQ